MCRYVLHMCTVSDSGRSTSEHFDNATLKIFLIKTFVYGIRKITPIGQCRYIHLI